MIVTQTLNIGGLERMVLHLASQLRQEQWRIHVFAYHQKETDQDLLEHFGVQGVPVEVYDKGPGFSLLTVGRILKSIVTNNVQIIHSQDLGCLLYAVLVKVLCLGCIRIVHTQHSFIHLIHNRRYRLYEQILTLFVDTLAVVSDDMKTTYESLGFRGERIAVIQNGVRFSACPPPARDIKYDKRMRLLRETPAAGALATQTDRYWILYLARFFPGKGQEHALGLWRNLPDNLRQQCALCFIGPESAPGQYDQFQQLCSTLPDRNSVHLLGGSSKPHRWLEVSDIFLSCSEYEGMPLSPLEAAGSGLPCLLSRIPGHLFLDGFAELFSLEDPKDGAAKLSEIIKAFTEDEQRLMDTLWNRGRHFRDVYSVETMSRRYAHLYGGQSDAAASGFSPFAFSAG